MSDANYPSARTDSGGESSRSSIEAQLAERKEAIYRRIDDIEEEIVAAPATIKSSILRHPVLGVAGAVAAGLFVSLLIARRRKPDVAPLHQRLVDQYLDAVGADVARRVRRGKPIEESVRRAMRDRTPLIVYAPEPAAEHVPKGYLSQFADLAFKAAVGFGIKSVLDIASSAVDVEALLEMLAADAEEGGSAGTGQGQWDDAAVGPVDPAEAP